MREFARYTPRTPARQFVNGESHLYLGLQIRLRIIKADVTRVTLTRGALVVSHTGVATTARVKALVHRWYRDRARIVCGDMLESMLTGFRGVKPPRLALRAMKTRWGSLSPAGTMTLNVELIRSPRRCIEYVICHELCHVAHRDHDARFYRLLGRVMPDWEKRKVRLEEALL